ncbi:MAG TPA: MgtC/SapB family protein [Gemmatimonadales bacterium]|jgi:putative Mg2+ transporter-C (MgtC) family protein
MSLVPQATFTNESLLLVRLLAAGLLASVLGWEREQARKSAGLRTHIVVAIAAALYTVLAELVVQQGVAGEGGQRSDPVRAIQAIAMGIGFLGGGVIFVAHRRDQVHGLTTAASIWATAAVGIAAGLAHYVLAAGATVILVIVLRSLARLEPDEPHKP